MTGVTNWELRIAWIGLVVLPSWVGGMCIGIGMYTDWTNYIGAGACALIVGILLAGARWN